MPDGRGRDEKGTPNPGLGGAPSRGDAPRGLAGVEAAFTAMETTLKRTGKTSKESAASIDVYNKRLETSLKDSKKSGDAVSIFGRAIEILGRDSAATRTTITAMSKALSSTAKVWSSEEVKSQKSRVEAIGVARNMTSRSSREFAIFERTRRQGNLAIFRDEMEKQSEVAKAQQTSGNIAERMGGVFNGVFSKLKSNGAQAAETIGDAVGLAPEVMGGLATALGPILLAFSALPYIFGRVAGSALDAAKAGAELNFNSFTAAIGSTNSYALTMSKVSLETGVSKNILQGLLEKTNEYNGSLLAAGEGYQAAIAGSEAGRNALRAQSIDFVGSQTAVGAALGLTADQSVEMGVKLATASRSGIRETQRAFLASSLEAKRLGTNIEAMINPTIMWANALANAGPDAEDAAQKTRAITAAVQNLGDAGAVGFKNVSASQMAGFTESFTKLMTNMSSTRLAALAMKPGESFNSIVSRLTEDKGIYGEAIKNAMSLVGIGKEGIAKGPAGNYSALALAGALGADTSDLVGSTQIGRIAAKTKNLAQVQGMIANQYDDKYSAAKSVGANLMRGNDVMGTIATYIKAILDIMIDFGSHGVMGAGKSDTAVQLGRERAGHSMSAAGAANTYGGMTSARSYPHI